MANLVMGAMGSLVPKLYELLKEEYKLQTGVKERICCLTHEFEAAQAALCKVAEVPWDQLDKQVQIWARQVREASYDMEDVLDTFLVRVQGPDSAEQEKSFLKTLKKMTNLFKKSKVRRKISGEVKDIISHLQEVTQRCRRYTVDDIVARPATVSTVDPRLHAMYTQVSKLVGIDESSIKLKSMLQLHDMSNTKLKIVSIVGIGGLGKTTLAKAVYDNLRGDFNCTAFVSVGRNPDLKKILQMILIALDKKRYQKFNFAVLQDITQFIDELREFLHDNKRCLIVIDDMWEKQSWETLKLAIPDDQNCEGRIIITTRNREVAINADEVYELPPLPYGSSRKLLYTRIYGDELKEIDYQQPDEVSDEILRKCAGIPLAIITMASLLVHEPRARWFDIYKSIGFGSTNNKNNVMKKILSFSYYDLPSHLRTCLLYLSAFPEDYTIPKVQLVWMWVAEGFVQKQEGKGLFQTGEGYFNDLINRSLIQQEALRYTVVHSCRVHDMVLEFIRSMSRDENFFTVFDISDQGTPVPSNVVRRLAHHNRTVGHSNLANISLMSKVRSFIAPVWKIDTWDPIFSFKLLRVLSIGHYHEYFSDCGDGLHVEHLGHLVHLRFLGVSGRRIKKFPEEIGSLKMLQTLDLSNSRILELPSRCSLPTELVCLRISYDDNVGDAGMFSVGRLTSLEELFIDFNDKYPPSCLLKELRNLTELRVLKFIWIYMGDEEMQRDFIESLRHLQKLQDLVIALGDSKSLSFEEDMEFVLPGNLRTLSLDCIKLGKHCINPSYHCKLSCLELSLNYMDEEDLKTMGMLPELHFLCLYVRNRSSPVTIGNISDCDPWCFRKLRCLKLSGLMVQLVVNKGDDGKKTISFHIWDGIVDESIFIAHSVSDSELQGDKEELQLLSVSDDVPPVSDEENKEGCISIRECEGARAAAPRFMPRLQVLYFQVHKQALLDPGYCNNLGLEFLSSLQEICVDIQKMPRFTTKSEKQVEEVKAALRRAAKVHPNQPKIHMRIKD